MMARPELCPGGIQGSQGMKIKIRGANTPKYGPNNFCTDSHNSATNCPILPADMFFELFMDSQNIYEARREKSRKVPVKQNFAPLVAGYHKSANICRFSTSPTELLSRLRHPSLLSRPDNGYPARRQWWYRRAWLMAEFR
jgi:hypothetical protein